MVYRDPTPLDPERDYTAEELAKFILEKMYGEHTREAMARSLLKANEVAEWAREVAQQLIDGTFDEGALNTEIERKLNELEEQYAPQLTNIKNEVEDARGNETTLGDRLNSSDSQLAQKANQSTVDNLLSSKVDKGGNEQVSWGMLDQEAKENITGGSTAVVGTNSVNTTNVVDKAITFKKLAGDVTGLNNNTFTFTYVDGKLTRVTEMQGHSSVSVVDLDYSADGKLNTVTEGYGLVNDRQSVKSTLNYRSDGGLNYIEKEVLV